MRLTILDRYFAREMLPSYGIGIFVFTFLLFMGRILRLMKLIIYEGTPVSYVMKFLLYLVPSFLIFTIPMAFLLAILVSLGRLSADSEMIALKSSGVSLFRMVRPYAAIALISFALVNFLVLEGLPWSAHKVRGLIIQMIQETSFFQVKERAFSKLGNHLLVYVNRYDPASQELKDIFIQDSRNPDREITIVAPKGVVMKDTSKKLMVVRLLNGNIHQMHSLKEGYQKLHFSAYDFRIDLKKKLTGRGIMRMTERDMSVSQLRQLIRERKKRGEKVADKEISLHKKFAIPFTCLIFVLVGFPLGIQPKRSGRSSGLIICLAIIFTYYISSIFFEVLGEDGILSPLVAVWLPNVLMTLVGLYLFRMAHLERVPVVVSFLSNRFIQFRTWLRGKIG